MALARIQADNDLLLAVMCHLHERGIVDLESNRLWLTGCSYIDVYVAYGIAHVEGKVEMDGRPQLPHEKEQATRKLGQFDLNDPNSLDDVYDCFMQARYNFFSNQGTMAEAQPLRHTRYDENRPPRGKVRIIRGR
jgi:hypothetical protein